MTLKAIAATINDMLAGVLPTVPIQSTDISEGFERPSLFVEFGDVLTEKFGGRSRERTVPVTIYYFPSNRNKNKLELLEVQETLEATFIGSLSLKDGLAVTVTEISSIKVDGVLQSSFDLYLFETDTTETEPFIDDLIVNIEKRD